jgi:prolipoprotein diacylglyceryltransferase
MSFKKKETKQFLFSTQALNPNLHRPMELLKIDITNPGFYYALFYAVAFFVGFVFLTIEGRRRGFPMLPWWLMIATSFFFFMVGTQLTRFGNSEWRQVLHFEPIATSPGRSVLGGILMGIPGLILARYVLKFRHTVVDAFAIVIPLCLAIQRIGCFLAGCCFGNPTSLPWGVQYNTSSYAFQHQVHFDLISSDATCAMLVHPVQLYDLICCLGILFLLTKLRTRLKAPGSLLTTSLLLYGGCRFFLEFFRAQNSSWKLFLLNPVQIALLMLLPMLALLLLFLRNRSSEPSSQKIDRPLSGKSCLAYFLGLTLLFALVSRWLSPLEIVILNLVLLPTLAIIVWQVFKSATHPSYRLATPVLVVIALLTMSQTFPEYSKKTNTRLSYNTFSLGAMAGNYDMTIGTPNTSCNGPLTSTTFSNSYSTQAIGIGRTAQRNLTTSLSYGVNAFVGKSHESVSGPNNFGNRSFSSYGVNPYVQYNWENIGLGVGFLVGDFTRIAEPMVTDNTSVKHYNFYPSFNFRAGKLNQFFFEYRLASQYPSFAPVMTHQLSMGIGLGQRYDGHIRIGTASNAAFFIAPTLPFGNHIVVEHYIALGGRLGNPYDHVLGLMASVNVHYKFGRREKSIEP